MVGDSQLPPGGSRSSLACRLTGAHLPPGFVGPTLRRAASLPPRSCPPCSHNCCHWPRSERAACCSSSPPCGTAEAPITHHASQRCPVPDVWGRLSCSMCHGLVMPRSPAEHQTTPPPLPPVLPPVDPARIAPVPSSHGACLPSGTGGGGGCAAVAAAR